MPDPTSEPRASTRVRILEESLRVFAAHGFEGATTRKIADAAGANVGLIKYYFDTKENLWQEAADRAFADLHETLGDALTDRGHLSSVDRLQVLGRRFVRFVAEKPEAVRFMQDTGTHDGPRMRWLVDRHLRPIFEALRESIQELQREKVLADDLGPIHIFYLLAGAISLIFNQAPECLYLTGIDPRDPEVAEAHADTLLRLLTRGQNTPRKKVRR